MESLTPSWQYIMKHNGEQTKYSSFGMLCLLNNDALTFAYQINFHTFNYLFIFETMYSISFFFFIVFSKFFLLC